MSADLAAPTTTILMPGDPGWDDARRAWNLAVDQHPAAIALPQSAHDVAVAIGFARERGLRVAAQGTGHNARPLGSLDDTVLVKTARMRQVTIDPVARIARAEAGAVWHEVVEAAAACGLAALAGSSPDVGVAVHTSAAGSAGWDARTAWRRTTSRRSSWSPRTAWSAPTRAPSRTCSGRCAAAAAASAWSPRSSCGCSRSPRSMPGSCGGPPTRPRGCCRPGET